jgi:hypothetical protein
VDFVLLTVLVTVVVVGGGDGVVMGVVIVAMATVFFSVSIIRFYNKVVQCLVAKGIFFENLTTDRPMPRPSSQEMSLRG